MDSRLLEALAKHGALADAAAVEYLSATRDPVAALETVFSRLRAAPFVLTLEDIRGVEVVPAAPAPPPPAAIHRAGELARRAAEAARPSPPKLRNLGRASEVAEDFRLLRDITGHSTCEGTLEDFSRYFANRLQSLTRLLRTRRELVGAVEIEKAKKLSREVRFIGMVSEVRSSRKGDRVVEVEDASDSAPVFISQESPLFKEPVLEDEVIGVVGKPTEKGLVIAQDIVRPDVPGGRAFPATNDGVSVAFVSDIHVGSKTFLEEKWAKFLAWIGDGDEVAASIRYLVVSGDVVDGIGVYPRQDEELAIDDIYGQYEALATHLQELPDHVTVLMIPGNHDAVRPAEPQPALPVGVQKLFDSNTVFAGNPSLLSLHGVRVLAYHGRSMDDFVSTIPGMNYHRPLDAMREMLRIRHLAPIYGGKTPIAPEAEDHLIVEEVPDIFATGHVHAVGVDAYRGVVLVNASTWQGQTSYQKMRNIDPTPACLPIVDLSTGQASVREF